MKIATWNVNSLSVRLPQVLAWLATNPVDALCLQELKLTDDKFPHAALQDAGYHAVAFGQKTYNGVAILTRTPVRDVVRNIPGFDDEQSRVMEPGSEKFAYKMRWLQALHDWIQAEMAAHPRLVLVGDFNVAPEDRDSYDPEGLRETIHHTTQERDHFKALLALGLTDAFRMFEQPEKSFSWWDYRMLGFQKNRGLRIDHILVSEALRPQVTACVVDRAPRKNPQPSDHAPVVVTLGA